MTEPLRLRGARHHHLDLDLDLQPGTWTAITGVSGSGKTSLVHDTLIAEGQRRLAGTWSDQARQRLGKVGRPAFDRLDGLPAPVAIGRRAESPNARSTVGTRSGGLAPLRLLWAREGEGPPGVALRRSHFSFNHPDGACPTCDGLGQVDTIDPAKLVADPTRSLRDGALVPTLPNGYIVYSQVTPEVLDGLCRDLGFTLDTPWAELSAAQQGMVLHGAPHRKVPFGKHDIASRMKWEGITARPREEGFYRGLVPVLRETLARSRNPNVLRFVTTRPCSDCGGTRLAGPGRTTRWSGATLPEVLAWPAHRLHPWLVAQRGGPVAERAIAEVAPLLARLVPLGLGHLALDRPTSTLSGGEAQRLALATQLGSALHGQLIALDEPTLGLHPESQDGLREVLEGLRARGHVLVTVEHDPDFVRHADRVVQLGPGAGATGGRIVSDGPPGRDPLGPPPTPRTPRPAKGTLWLRGARHHGLDGADLPVRLGVLNVVLGPSGAGKSSLVFGTLLPALTGGDAGPHDHVDPLPEGMQVQAVDAKPLGRTSRSTPATWTGLFDLVRKRFAATEAARARGWKAGRFAFNSAAGRCPDCEGLGVERVRLHLLDDLLRPCPTCEGRRYAPDTLEVTWRGLSIADVLALDVATACERLGNDDALGPLLHAMRDLGLGHLPLGQPSQTLSRGEGQRIKLATLVAQRRPTPTLLLLDEPDRGLHPDDLARLLAVFERLVDQGHTLLAISHHRHVWAAADHRVEVRDGRTHDAPDLDGGRASTARAPRPPAPLPTELVLRGVRTHHLKGFDLALPHRALIGIVGPSGAGKSSLALDTLAAEGRRRLASSLPFHVRTFLRRLPAPSLEGAEGLTPTLHLRADEGAMGPHATLATQTGLGPMLRLLWSRAGTVDGQPTALPAGAFTTAAATGACPTCAGRGEVRSTSAERLVSHPERALADGAMEGTKVGRYLGEPDGQYLATLVAAWEAAGVGHRALHTPWNALDDEARRIALHGSGDTPYTITWRYQRGARSGEHTFEGPWRGLLTVARDEAQHRAKQKTAEAWAEALVWAPCAACGGTGLRSEARAVTVGGTTLPELLQQPLAQVGPFLTGLSSGRERSVADALRPELRPRLDALVDLGLGALPLGARVDDLPPSERQRVRLVDLACAGLAHLTLVLDEPAAGLEAPHRLRLIARLRGLVDQGHTVVVVTHQPALIAACDHLVELGPGAGADGGHLLAQGPPSALRTLDTPTGRLLARDAGVREPDGRWGEVPLPAQGTVALVGPGASRRLQALDVDEEATATARRGTVLEALDLARSVQKAYAAISDLPAKAFSFRSPAGRCPVCGGHGTEATALDLFADLRLPCSACGGRRLRAEALAVRWHGLDLGTLLHTPVDQLAALPAPVGVAGEALLVLGLGGLTLGRELGTLSVGERQRLRLAPLLLSGVALAGHRIRIAEPGRGLHGSQAESLHQALRALADRGALVIAHVARDDLLEGFDLVVDCPTA